ncbi:GatB/YqeY domain-containing protein [Hathewaya histolytica]|uniref:GatB/Yqey domain-containing protein n=1 Tax=Hathewaya histolytica TaxID=1498 RepID=A0A4U9RH63_HATHI|nr:GatB/YqeY domain-containing protein [Hathewaya histolytica]VTQ90616.1 GatB/Yqey domain-containing protein [Hathewaya histolytica]
MSLKEVLQQDWKDAVKAKDKLKTSVISMAKAAVLLYEKSSASSEVTDDIVIDIISKEIKQRREAIVEFEKGNRTDLIKAAQEEIEILLKYLPQQLTENEIKEIIEKSATEVGASSMKDMGKLMSALVPKTKGKADGKLVSTLVKEYLNK